MFLSTVDLGWSSFDYIQVGGKQTNAEYKAQISMFAILAAPIFIGTDLRGIDDASLAAIHGLADNCGKARLSYSTKEL